MEGASSSAQHVSHSVLEFLGWQGTDTQPGMDFEAVLSALLAVIPSGSSEARPDEAPARGCTL